MWVKRIWKAISWSVGVMFAAGIGQFGWERVILPAISWAGGAALHALTSSSQYASDTLYGRVGSVDFFPWEGFAITLAGFAAAMFYHQRWSNSILARGVQSEHLVVLLKSVKHLYMVSIFVAGVQLMVFGFAQAQAPSFAYRLRAVSEFITPEHERQLKSRFARVETEAQYRQLMAEVRRVAADNNIGLRKDSD